MKNEFDSIGFFMSKHPLTDYESILKSYNAVSYGKINELDNGKELIISGTLMSVSYTHLTLPTNREV